MDIERIEKQIAFLLEIDKAKNVFRNTILIDKTRKENDAEHSWHMAIAAIVLSEYSNDKNIDISKVIIMSLIHDIIEIDSGDVFAYSDINYEEKNQKEKDGEIEYLEYCQ